MNVVDYSKAIYHLANLEDSVKRASLGINTEDISVQFFFNCMKERIEKEKELEKLYENIVSAAIQRPYKKIETEEHTFYVFPSSNEYIRFVNTEEGKKVIGKLVDEMPVFYTDKGKVLVPENEAKALVKPYIFLGWYPVLIV